VQPFLPAELDKTPEMVDAFDPDVVISFLDAWNVPVHTFGGRPWVPWFPMESVPLSPMTRAAISKAFMCLPCSQFGIQQLWNAGIPGFYVPCAIDSEDLEPKEKAEARAIIRENLEVNIGDETFLCLMVADNCCRLSRKAFAEQIAAFAQFHAAHPDSHLWLHTCIDRRRGGLDLSALVAHYGLEKCVTASDQETYNDVGFSRNYIGLLCSAADCLLACSMSEGFGVPIIEAQACGCPVVAGKWTAMDEIVGSGSVVTKSQAYWHSGFNAHWFMPNIEAVAGAIVAVYERRNDPEVRELAKAFAADFEIESVWEQHWEGVLWEIEERLAITAKN
jgi:glycosyltransferase involved in cell wall biosynthesis